MSKLKWTYKKVKLKDLTEHEKNPRTITPEQLETLKESLKRFSLAEIPAVNKDMKIIAGHQRIRVLKEMHGEDFEIDVRFPSRKLTKKEHDEYLIRSNKNTGEWDWEKLEMHFSPARLLDWGFGEWEIDQNITVTTDNYKKIEEEETKTAHQHKCTNCGHEF